MKARANIHALSGGALAPGRSSLAEVADPAERRLAFAPTATDLFRQAMWQLASGVSVITHGSGEYRTGLTATSVSSLSAEPPSLIVCVNRSVSFFRQLERGDLLGVSVLGGQHTEIADGFSRRSGDEGAERFAEGGWIATPAAVSLLAEAITAFECEAEDIFERHSHAIIIGRVRRARPKRADCALLYWRGAYDRIGWSVEEVSRATGITPTRA